MGYWYYKVRIDSNHPYTPYNTCLLFINDDGSDPLLPPDDSITTARIGRSCGSGAYYKSVSKPYLEDGSFRADGNRYNGESVPYYSAPDWRGFGAWCREVSSQHLLVSSGVRNTGNATCGHGSVTFYQLLKDGSNVILASITALWSQTDGAYPPTNVGAFGCQCKSQDDFITAAQWCLEYFGLDPGLLFNPYRLGSQNLWATVDQTARANIQVRSSVSWLDSRWNYSSGEVKVDWKYDQNFPNRMAEWMSVADMGIIPGRIRNAAATALANTMAGLPEVSANSCANLFELASGVDGLVRSTGKTIGGMARALIDGVSKYKDPRNLWLSWRYVYNTTKMDLNDYKSVTSRLLNMTGAPTFKVHGFGSGDGFSIRCVRQYRTADFDVTNYDTKRLLRTYGLQLSAYNAWDMVPFSFMVDWFTHVGPKIELAQNWSRHYDFKAEDVWYSYRENVEHGYVYFRWHGVDPSVPPTYVSHETSKRTITYRLADTVSIFT